LRNPLSSVSNAIGVLKMTAPDHATILEVMSRQIALLVRLIDELLDVARISRGKMALKRAPATLNAIIDAAIESVAPMLESGRRAVNVRRLADDVTLQADPQRLAQVFSNLLHNAVKYSDDGAPIEVTVARDGDEVEIAFTDHGIGLTQEQQGSIFELFAQVDTALERSRGGLGIGLTLAQHIVELHGGQLRVHSGGNGCGSTFSVCLPPDMVVPVSPPTAAPPMPHGRPSVPRRVLVVDDNLDAAGTLGTILNLLGHNAQCLNDPQKVIENVENFAPEIVFLDIGMPGLSGYDVARALRAHPRGQDLILVALTGWGQAADRKRTAEAGFDHHVVKPADLATIQSICDADPNTQATRASRASAHR
jgi:CheY-like chemotaxis protein